MQANVRVKHVDMTQMLAWRVRTRRLACVVKDREIPVVFQPEYKQSSDRSLQEIRLGSKELAIDCIGKDLDAKGAITMNS